MRICKEFLRFSPLSFSLSLFVVASSFAFFVLVLDCSCLSVRHRPLGLRLCSSRSSSSSSLPTSVSCRRHAFTSLRGLVPGIWNFHELALWLIHEWVGFAFGFHEELLRLGFSIEIYVHSASRDGNCLGILCILNFGMWNLDFGYSTGLALAGPRDVRGAYCHEFAPPNSMPRP
jgi:hypothetical protein